MLAAYRQTLQLVANWRRSSIANTCGCRCIHLRFVGCLNKRIFIYLYQFLSSLHFALQYSLYYLAKENHKFQANKLHKRKHIKQ